MALQTAIDAVKVQLPDEAATFGIDDAKIGAMLDTPLTITHTILSAYRALAAKTMMMTDVNESGSNRNLSVLNTNARAMITYWQGIADKEDESNEVELIPRFRSYRANRV